VYGAVRGCVRPLPRINNTKFESATDLPRAERDRPGVECDATAVPCEFIVITKPSTAFSRGPVMVPMPTAPCPLPTVAPQQTPTSPDTTRPVTSGNLFNALFYLFLLRGSLCDDTAALVGCGE
jgi:hypothetical protein